MTPRRTPPPMRWTAAVLAAVLALTAPGLGPAEAVAGVVTRAAPVGPVVPVTPGVGAAPAIAAPTLSSSLGAVALPNLTLTGPGLLPPVQAAAAAIAAPAAAATAVARAAAAAQLAALPSAAAAVAVPARAAPGVSEREAARPQAAVFEGLRAGGARLAQAAGRSVADARGVSGVLFDGAAPRAASAVAPEDAPRADAPARPARGLLRRVAAPLGVASSLSALGTLGWHATAPAVTVPLWQRALDAAGWTGYAVGNALAFVFAIPQVHKTFKDGSAGATPAWRAWTGAGASLALGVLMGPLTGHAFWAIQNTFGALTMLAPLALGKLLERRGWRFTGRKAAALTALTSLLLLAPSAGLYYGAAAVLPGLLRAALGAAGVCALALGLQVATGVMFLLLFAPDIITLLRGRPPKGFTPMFSLLFFAASAGFVAWTLQMAHSAPAGSSERVQFLIYAAQNAVYALVSFLSYWFGRAQDREKT